jgi:methyl-accepting chemotaxis protein
MSANALPELFDGNEAGMDEILAIIEQAGNGDYMRLPTGSDQLSKGLARFIGDVRDKGSISLSNVVNISVSMTETAVMAANLLHFLRGVDNESQSVAAAAEEMASTVTEIGKFGEAIVGNTKIANAAVKASVEALGQSDARMGVIAGAVTETSERISSIQALASRIAEISDGIKKISSQTNLLAINAAVEAARAGDAGRGFAVVASEVKALSDRTAAATVEISQIIQDLRGGMSKMVESMGNSSAAVAEGSSAMAKLRQAVGDVDRSISDVSENATHIAEALRQQKSASMEVATSIGRIAEHSAESADALMPIVDAMDNAQEAISQQLSVLATCNLPNKIIRLAQSDHVLWKKRLANMVIGREGLKPNELSDHHNCRLGKWYYQVTDPTIKGRQEFAQLEEPHAAVHRHGIEAARLFNMGDQTGALREIDKVNKASEQVLALLKRLER